MNATIIEVAPRDGFQPIGPFIPTDEKVKYVEAAFASGLRRIEIGSFVNPKAVPQLSDTDRDMAAIGRHEMIVATPANSLGGRRVSFLS